LASRRGVWYQRTKAAPKSIAELDHRAGQILDVLDELGISDDTIVVWVSDNAAARLTRTSRPGRDLG
jgi:arylsulfatase A-like enzyme